MKKLFYSLALAAIFTVSCNKEADLAPEKSPINDLSNLPTHVETFRADFGAGLTRTDYDGKKFTWLQNDSIYVQVQSEPDAEGHYSFSFAKFYAQSTGASVEFKGEVPDGYVTATPAFYVAINSGLDLGDDGNGSFDGNYYVQIPAWTTIGADPKEGYYAADPAKPLANMPLYGVKQEDGSFKFTSMTGALKLTLTGLDAAASLVQIVNSNGKLTGDFAVSETGTLTMDGGREGTYTSGESTRNFSNHYSVTSFTQSADNSVTVYIPMPVGTLPAGTTLYVHDADLNVLYERTFNKDVQIARNTVTELASLKASYDIEDLGTGRYYDYLVWRLGEFETEYVDVKISRDASTGKIFIENPYGAAISAFEYTPEGKVAGPDATLTLNIDAEGNVNYDEHATGIYMPNWTDEKNPDGDELAITDPYWYSTNYPTHYAAFGRGNNFVAKFAADGKTPANIILSPVYSGVNTSYWYGDAYIQKNPIQIIFPGSEPVNIDMTVAYNGVESADVAAPTVSIGVQLGADLAGAKVVIAENRDAAIAAFASGTGVTTINASGNAIVSMPANAASGTYTAFTQAQVASGLAPVANYIIATEFKYEAATDYETVGTGKFYDSVAWPYLGGTTGTYVDVEIRKHTSEKKYQIVDPYGVAAKQFGYSPAGTVSGPDKELVITIDANDGVLFPDSFRTGIYMANWENDEMLITTPYYYSSNYASYYGYMENGSNFVARYDANGVPTNILLSPIYDSDSGYWMPGYIWSNPIEIIFPGASHVDLTAEVAYSKIVDENPAQAVAEVNIVLGSDVVSAQLVIAADKASAQAALAAGTGVASVTGTGVVNVNFPANAPSGKYTVYAKIQTKDGFTEAAQRLVFSEEFQYFSAADDKGYTLADIIGTYSAKTKIFTGSWGQETTITMTIAESDDPFSGDIMITSFAPTFMNRYGANTPIENVGGVYGYFDTKTGLANFADGQEFLYNANNDINWSLVNVSNEGSDVVFMLDPVGTLTCEDYIGMAAGQYGAQGILQKPVVFTRTAKTTVAPLKDPVVSGSQRVRTDAVSHLEKTERNLAKNAR